MAVHELQNEAESGWEEGHVDDEVDQVENDGVPGIHFQLGNARQRTHATQHHLKIETGITRVIRWNFVAKPVRKWRFPQHT